MGWGKGGGMNASKPSYALNLKTLNPKLPKPYTLKPQLKKTQQQLGMFPLILTVFNREYKRGYYNPSLRTVSIRRNIPT